MFTLSRFTVIVAMTEQYGIGKNGSIPWKNEQDMAHFRKITIGNGNNAVIMGRKTYESLPPSMRPLPNRRNVVLSSSIIPGVDTASSLVKALHMCVSGVSGANTGPLKGFGATYNKTYIIGGQRLYQEVIQKWPHLCDEIIISHIPRVCDDGTFISYDCDTFFPYDDARAIATFTEYFLVNNAGTSTEVPESSINWSNNNDLVIETINVRRSHPEEQYLNLLKRILREGENRDDRTGVGTKSLFGCNMEFDLRQGFPLLTTKQTWFKGIAKELLFFISGKTDTKILERQGVNIWKENTSAEYLEKYKFPWREGDMGPGYGHQWRHAGAKYMGCDVDYTGQGIDQLSDLIVGLKKDPFGRRHIISAWDVANIHWMALPPCHCFLQFYVGCDEKNNEDDLSEPKYLDCMMYQRSADMFLGVPFNIASYALLMHMIGHVTGLIPRRFIHNFGDAHIYTNHFDQVQEQLTRTPLPFPQLSFKENRTQIDDFTFDDIVLENYTSWPAIKGKMAI